jgi:Ca-activated chloride channel family protein
VKQEGYTFTLGRRERLMRGIRFSIALLSLVVLSVTAVGLAGDREAAVIKGELSYQLAASGLIERGSMKAMVPTEVVRGVASCYYSQDSVREAAALANFIVGLEAATDAYFAELIATCEQRAIEAEIECPENLTDMTCEEYDQQEREYTRLRCLGNEEIAPDIDAGLLVMIELQSFLAGEAAALGSDVLEGEIELAAAIASNMVEGCSAPPYNDEGIADENPWSVPGSGGGNLGVTPGGAQDIGYVREVVETGYVPLPTHLAVEGLFSEHHLPIEEEEPCQQLLCVRSAVAAAPVFNRDDMSYFVQVGFSSGLTAETFERPPLNLAVVIDKSGSMRDSGTENEPKIGAVKSALQLMVDRLGEDDRLAIIAFNNDAWLMMESTPVTDREEIKRIIGSLTAAGGTCIECGLQLGFEIVAANQSEERLARVLLLTDALPNVGRTGEGAFLTMASEYADIGIGLSTFGVGFNFGQELVSELSRIRGGNYFFLEDAARIEEIFTVDFDYLVTPLAYDLHMEVQPSAGFVTKDVYGIESWDTEQTIQLDVNTLFLSRNHGAVLLELATKSPRASRGRTAVSSW